MALVTPLIGLKVWDLATDPYDSDQLAENWARVDQHDHSPGKGNLIQTASIADGAITASKVAPDAFPTLVLQDGAVTTSKLADGSVTTSKFASGAVNAAAMGIGSVTLPALDATVLPPGVVWIYGGTSAPTGWFICDGSAISRVTYANLFSVVGTHYGTGDGVNTFNLPDMRGRFPVGLGVHGDVNAMGKQDAYSISLRRPNHVHKHLSKIFDWNGVGAVERPANNGGGSGTTVNNPDGSTEAWYDSPTNYGMTTIPGHATLYKQGVLDTGGTGTPYRYQVTSSNSGAAYNTLTFIIKS